MCLKLLKKEYSVFGPKKKIQVIVCTIWREKRDTLRTYIERQTARLINYHILAVCLSSCLRGFRN